MWGTEAGACQWRRQSFLSATVAPVLIGMEATGNSQWFVELVEDLGHEIWIGDAAQIRASYVRTNVLRTILIAL